MIFVTDAYKEISFCTLSSSAFALFSASLWPSMRTRCISKLSISSSIFLSSCFSCCSLCSSSSNSLRRPSSSSSATPSFSAASTFCSHNNTFS
eukprot:Gb_07105 [translate_table: standard]